jgi:hypothetical protein
LPARENATAPAAPPSASVTTPDFSDPFSLDTEQVRLPIRVETLPTEQYREFAVGDVLRGDFLSDAPARAENDAVQTVGHETPNDLPEAPEPRNPFDR